MFVNDIIRLIREKTGNTSVTSDASGNAVEGISDELIQLYLNDAMAYLQSRISAQYPGVFVHQNIQAIVANQEGYTIDDNVFLSNKIVSVEYSSNGALDKYYPLAPASLLQRRTTKGDPYQYIRRHGEILINPIPTHGNGKLRVNYHRALDKLAKIVGVIDDINGSNVVLVDDDWLDSASLLKARFVTTAYRSTAEGAIRSYDLKVASYDSTSLLLVMDTAPVEGTDMAEGDYILVGRFANYVLPVPLPERMLDYARVYTSAKLYGDDSSINEINEREDVKEILLDIMDAFADLSDDVAEIPVIDEDLA